jgi:hypothetical protein
MQLVAAGSLPVWFGSPHPCAAIVEQDGRLRIRALVIDPAEAEADRAAALAAGRGWMPENYYALGKPTGEIYCDAGSRDELVALMQAMDWPPHW